MKTETSDSVELVRLGFDYGRQHGGLEARAGMLAGVCIYALMLLAGATYLYADTLARRRWGRPPRVHPVLHAWVDAPDPDPVVPELPQSLSELR